MPPRPKVASLNVRISADELSYLQSLADELELTLSDALRTAIARSLLRDAEHGELVGDLADDENLKWVARNARTPIASPLDENEADDEADSRPTAASSRPSR